MVVVVVIVVIVVVVVVVAVVVAVVLNLQNYGFLMNSRRMQVMLRQYISLR